MFYRCLSHTFKQRPNNFVFPLLASLGVGYYKTIQRQKNADCLGIVGYVGDEKKAEKVCLEGLQALSIKGYDSCGIASVNENHKFRINKFAKEERFGGDCLQKLQNLLLEQKQHKLAIAHTRWATHGNKNDENAHPHCDHKERIALVHNGIIENYQVLLDDIKNSYNLQPKSQTDSEVIALMLGASLDEGKNIIESIKETCSKLIGSYNLAIICLEEPNSVFLIKNSGEMAVAKKKDSNQYYFSSEPEILKEEQGFEDIILIKDNDIIKVENNQISNIYIGASEAKVQIKLKPGIHHYFIQEMSEQPDAVAKCLNYGARLCGEEKGMVKLGGLDSNEQKLVEIENLLIGACGTSYFASLYGQHLMRLLGCFKTVEVKIASEITKEDFPLTKGGLLSVSQSGMTTDLLRPFKEAGELGVTRFNIVNNVESTLAREAKCGLFLNAGKEISIASTKAFICQVTAFCLISVWFAQKINFKKSQQQREALCEELKELQDKVRYVVEKCPSYSKEVAEVFKHEKHVFLLGSGLGECIAKEGSLKMKELTYKHCQAYSVHNISNGYFNYAKQQPGTPTFFIILDDEHKEKCLETLILLHQKLKVRAFVISDLEDEIDQKTIQENCENVFWVPHSGYLSALLCIIPIQLAAFQTTLALGRDPDKPRNLTKVVL